MSEKASERDCGAADQQSIQSGRIVSGGDLGGGFLWYKKAVRIIGKLLEIILIALNVAVLLALVLGSWLIISGILTEYLFVPSNLCQSKVSIAYLVGRMVWVFVAVHITWFSSTLVIQWGLTKLWPKRYVFKEYKGEPIFNPDYERAAGAGGISAIALLAVLLFLKWITCS
ncbi:MAG TPA: hypothetical protein PKH77_00305 [Anaerolineae bacterium]|nr:hypothetical protein [Anaerolineae bacterium]